MKKHKFNIFPEMVQDDYSRLKNDLMNNGFDPKTPIYLYEGEILDGWNRYRACSEIGIDPEYVEFEGTDTEAINFVMRTNKRRNLSSSQWSCIAVEAEEIVEIIKAEAKARQLLNLKKGDEKPDMELIPERETSSQKLADLFNTNERYVRDAEKYKTEKPEIFEAVKSGEKNWSEIKQAEKKEKNNVVIQELRQKEVLPPTGKYDVIVIDPPWQMEKIERDVAPDQVGFDYPTMTIEEIKNFKLPSENNCHVFMWITQKHHRHGFDIFDSWGVKFICEFVWHKNGGFQPFGLPQFNHEYVMYGRIGTPQFADFKNFFTCFNAKRTGHSAKPEEFYDTLRRVTAGKRIDIFNRRDIEGFDKWGNEA